MRQYYSVLPCLALLLLPTPTLASSGLLETTLLGIEPPPGDISGHYIKELFLSDGTKPSGLADAIGEINKVWFIFCALLVFLMMSMGMVHSAADGEFFGKKHSAIFVPARILIAGTMLVPGATDNMSLVQKAVAQVSYYSIGAASKVWEITISSVAQGKTLTPPGDPNAPDVVRVLLEGEVCRLIMTRFINDPNNVAQAAGARNSVVWNFDLAEGKGIFSADYTRNGQLIVPGICGEIVVTLPKGGFASPPTTKGSIDHLIAPEFNIDRAAFAVQNQWIREQLNGEIRTLASEIFQKILTDGDLSDAERRKTVATSHRLINDYNRQLSEAINQAAAQVNISSTNALKEMAKSEGWSSAGASFLMLTRLNGQIASAATSKITAQDFLVTNGRVSTVIGSARNSGLATTIFARLFGTSGAEDLLIQMNKIREVTDIVTSQISEGVIREASQAGVRHSDISILKGIDPTNSGFYRSLIDGMANGGEWAANPFEANINFGQNLVLAGGSIIGTSGKVDGFERLPVARGVAMATRILASRNYENGEPDGLDKAARLFGFALYFAGIVLAYVMPMLPAIFWILGVVGFMVLILEAVIAAPLWMLGHLRLDGEGFAGSRGVAGYEIVISLLIRPTTMVIGLVVAIVIYQFGSVLIARSMYPAIISAAGGHFGGLTGVVVWTVMTAIVSAMLTFVVFKESLGIADRITTWIAIREAGSSRAAVTQAQQMSAIMGYQAMRSGKEQVYEAIEGDKIRRAEAAYGRAGLIKNASSDDGKGAAENVGKYQANTNGMKGE